MEVHIGKMIRHYVENSKISPSEIADKLHIVRNNVYQMYRKKTIQVDRLYEISLLTKNNPFRVLADELDSKLKVGIVEEPTVPYEVASYKKLYNDCCQKLEQAKASIHDKDMIIKLLREKNETVRNGSHEHKT